MKALLIPFLGALFFTSCAPSTPTSRIESNPAIYENLSASHKELVQQGKIDRGMPPGAVYLAWGKTSREYAGSDDKGSTLRWDYAGSQPVYTTNYYAGYASGYRGPYGRRYPGYAYGVAPQVEYIPYRKATVWFVNEKVNKWERIR